MDNLNPAGIAYGGLYIPAAFLDLTLRNGSRKNKGEMKCQKKSLTTVLAQ